MGIFPRKAAAEEKQSEPYEDANEGQEADEHQRADEYQKAEDNDETQENVSYDDIENTDHNNTNNPELHGIILHIHPLNIHPSVNGGSRGEILDSKKYRVSRELQHWALQINDTFYEVKPHQLFIKTKEEWENEKKERNLEAVRWGMVGRVNSDKLTIDEEAHYVYNTYHKKGQLQKFKVTDGYDFWDRNCQMFAYLFVARITCVKENLADQGVAPSFRHEKQKNNADGDDPSNKEDAKHHHSVDCIIRKMPKPISHSIAELARGALAVGVASTIRHIIGSHAPIIAQATVSMTHGSAATTTVVGTTAGTTKASTVGAAGAKATTVKVAGAKMAGAKMLGMKTVGLVGAKAAAASGGAAAAATTTGAGAATGAAAGAAAGTAAGTAAAGGVSAGGAAVGAAVGTKATVLGIGTAKAMAAGSATAKVGCKMMIVHPFAGAATLGAGATLIMLSKNKDKKWLKRNANKFEFAEDGTVSIEGEVVGVAQEEVEGVEGAEEGEVMEVTEIEEGEGTTDAETNATSDSSDEEIEPDIEALHNDIEKELQVDIEEKLNFDAEDDDEDCDVGAIIEKELKNAEKEMADKAAGTEELLGAGDYKDRSGNEAGIGAPSRVDTDESMPVTERTSSSRTDSLDTIDRADSAKDRALRAREELFTKSKRWVAKAEEDERFVKGKKWMAKGQERMNERMSSFDLKAKKDGGATT
ncbi:MAG: hypothetical protein M1831_005645 [Alyxoria varia]|nr:MAG: hypothetical protein M1831_005645 [Alyxoria varia]